jgi:hypothetical protein
VAAVAGREARVCRSIQIGDLRRGKWVWWLKSRSSGYPRVRWKKMTGTGRYLFGAK